MFTDHVGVTRAIFPALFFQYDVAPPELKRLAEQELQGAADSSCCAA
jgi:hypothetical protein